MIKAVFSLFQTVHADSSCELFVSSFRISALSSVSSTMIPDTQITRWPVCFGFISFMDGRTAFLEFAALEYIDNLYFSQRQNLGNLT